MRLEFASLRYLERYLSTELWTMSFVQRNLHYALYKKERIMEGLPFLLTCAVSFGCQLVYAAYLCCQLGMLAITGFTRDCCLTVRCLSLFFQCCKCIILGKKYTFLKWTLQIQNLISKMKLGNKNKKHS